MSQDASAIPRGGRRQVSGWRPAQSISRSDRRDGRRPALAGRPNAESAPSPWPPTGRRTRPGDQSGGRRAGQPRTMRSRSDHSPEVHTCDCRSERAQSPPLLRHRQRRWPCLARWESDVTAESARCSNRAVEVPGLRLLAVTDRRWTKVRARGKAIASRAHMRSRRVRKSHMPAVYPPRSDP
jgi:hypothetical protein